MIMRKSKRKSVKLGKEAKSEVKQYPIDNIASLKELEASQKGRYAFRYDYVTNKTKQKNRLIIAPCDLMDGRLGVYAGGNMQVTAKSIGRYAGKRSKRGGSVDSLYAFQISDNDGKLIEFIDADKNRDWTGFINHSPCSNLYIDQRKVNGKYEILFHLERPIKKGEQLLYNYGEFYFADANIKPFYLHASDNWRSAEEVYRDNQLFYAKEKYIFDKSVCTDLELPFSKTTDFLIPEIFLPIFKGNEIKVKKMLDRSYPIEVLAYTCNRDKIQPYAKQQHLTPLMFACYLGNKKIIRLLLSYGADASRRTLNSGKSSFDILMSGLADQETVQESGALLIRKMQQISILNQDGLSALHYAVLRSSNKLVKIIINKFENERHDWLRMIFTSNKKIQPHAGFDYCLLHGQFDMLSTLLLAALDGYGSHQDGILSYINKRKCFDRAIMNKLSQESLLKFQKILLNKKFKLIQRKTKLLTQITKLIKLSG